MNNPGTQLAQVDSAPARDELSYLANAVMPAQFYSARRGAASVEPIIRLMGGVLIDAVRCYQRNFESRNPSRRQEFREAQFWIFDKKGDGPFSFQGICESLEINPGGLRASIVRWQRNRQSGDKQRMIRRSPVNIARRMESGRKKAGPEREAFRT